MTAFVFLIWLTLVVLWYEYQYTVFYAYFIVLECLWYAEFGDSLLLFIYQAFYSFSFFDFKSLFFKHWIKFKKNNFINYHKCAKVSDWVAPHNYRCCHNTLFRLTSIWAAEQLTISRMLSMYETIFVTSLERLNQWTWTNGDVF